MLRPSTLLACQLYLMFIDFETATHDSSILFDSLNYCLLSVVRLFTDILSSSVEIEPFFKHKKILVGSKGL